MIVNVRLFAAARQWAECETLPVTCPGNATLHDLRQALESACPALASLLPHVRFAVNTQYVSDDHRLKPDDDVACIPPVSGG